MTHQHDQPACSISSVVAIVVAIAAIAFALAIMHQPVALILLWVLAATLTNGATRHERCAVEIGCDLRVHG